MQPPDPEITREAVATIRHQFPDQARSLQVMVQNGRVALEGELAWHYQRDVVEALVRAVRGVTLVANKICVGARSSGLSKGSAFLIPNDRIPGQNVRSSTRRTLSPEDVEGFNLENLSYAYVS